ncbi:pirin family protein [Chengkuizengella sp. SCS-71B]|uniref:pirin family protein n=1 Tax=Chengkuizengella sp. SCS-71B TaxID=3115290 RepID=UPI0032C24441
MIKVYPKESRFSRDHGWLQSNFSFSFADFYDPENLQFGSLRVFNDDFVRPSQGFGKHPHEEMEIVSIVLDGELKHEDSEGNSAVTTFGGIQRMSAGTGIYHSEFNPSTTKEVNFFQLWFLPNKKGVTPEYEKTTYEPSKMKNNLLPVVSNQASEHVAYINQDVTIYMSDLETGKELTHTQESGRKVFLFVIEGDVTLNKDIHLSKRDSARLTDETSVLIQAKSDARFLLIDLV